MSTQRDRWGFIHLFMKHAPLGPGETEGDLNRKALRLLRYAATHRRIEVNLSNAAYRKPKEKLYIVRVNGICEPVGQSHIIKSIGKGAKPEVYCGIDTGDLNWTGNPRPPTELCKRCGKLCPLIEYVEDKEATAKAIAKRDRIDAKMEAIAPIVYGALTVSVRIGDREVYIP